MENCHLLEIKHLMSTYILKKKKTKHNNTYLTLVLDVNTLGIAI